VRRNREVEDEEEEQEGGVLGWRIDGIEEMYVSKWAT